MAGSLPPSSSVTRLRSGAADRATFLPVSTEPVKLILRGHRVRRHQGAELVTAAHDVDHAGREDVAQELAHLQRGQRRERRRLEHQVLPASNAGAIFQKASVSGKFHGVMAATTPSGRRASST